MGKAIKNNEPAVLVRLGKYFINQENIRGIKRTGKSTLISLIKGDDVTVDIDYDKVKSILPSLKS